MLLLYVMNARATVTKLNVLAQTVAQLVVSPAAERPGTVAFEARASGTALRCAAAHHAITTVD